ncbi:hypothetical protein FB566_3372 [Stackebrandtia endophytica]|uniref:Uncharacterized protein n=1 Tax=Stackebrandtia endophytica TaxID=1496996 RepID=A0A543AYZ9_9ACTN|nr:hypothetical protein [Stackebrandtia endophytica]TQL77805.1 hypothetical protein FB566_3372 [Stackebrandtia endophytica]
MDTKTKRRLGLSFPAILGLALLGAPRVVAHDLELVSPAVNSILVFAPLIIWVIVALWARVANPFLTLLVVGVCYGVILAAVHQVLWGAAFDEAPTLGGNLEGALSPGAESALIRVFSVGSSLITGALVGAATGAVAWVLAKLTGRSSGR